MVITAYTLMQCWCIIALSILQRYLKKNLLTLNQLKILFGYRKIRMNHFELHLQNNPFSYAHFQFGVIGWFEKQIPLANTNQPRQLAALRMPNLPKYSFEILKSVCPGAAQRCQRRFVFFFVSKGRKEETIPLIYQPKEMHKLILKITFKFTQHYYWFALVSFPPYGYMS